MKKYSNLILPEDKDADKPALVDSDDHQPLVSSGSGRRNTNAIQQEKERLQRKYGGNVEAHGTAGDGSELII